MRAYSFGELLYEVPQLMEVREAHSEDSSKSDTLSPFLVAKIYMTSDLQVADMLLKKAVPFIESQYSSKAKLIDVFIGHGNPKAAEFHVIYVLHIVTDLDEETLKRDDSFGDGRRGREGYTLGVGFQNNPASRVSIMAATRVHFQQPLALKMFVYQTLLELNQGINEGILQARVRHKHTCHLLDITLQKTGKLFELCLVMEKIAKSLMQDIFERYNSDTRYSEADLLRYLREIATALLHAKKQDIAHRDIKPDNVLITDTGSFVLQGFGTSWEQQLRSVTADGVFSFTAPELRTGDLSKKSPFSADVFSLGMTALCMGTLGLPQENRLNESIIASAIEEKVCALPYSDAVKTLIGRMTAYDPRKRPLIDEVASLPAESPRLSEVSFPAALVRLSFGKVSALNFEEDAWGPPVSLSADIKWDKESRYALLDAGRLFCCGNSRFSQREAYVLHLGDSQVRVEELPLLSHRRLRSGVLSYKEIFVFGGSGEKSVEVLASKSWTLLSETMSCERCSFTPCEFQGRAYLFSSYVPACIDVLELVSRTFQPAMSVKLSRECTGTVCTMVGEVLTLVSSTYTAQLGLCGGSPKVTTHHCLDLFPVSAPVVTNSSVYWVEKYGSLMQIDVRPLD